MGVAGIGVDVVSVSRLARVRGRQGRLLEHVVADEELVGGVDDLRAAQLWAGKEAVAKTLGTGFWQHGVGWPDVRIARDRKVTFHGKAAALAAGSTVALDFAVDGDTLVAVAIRWSSP